MEQVIVIVLLATLFAICFGAVEIYIKLSGEEKTVWQWTEIAFVALMLFIGSLTVGFLTYLGLNFLSGMLPVCLFNRCLFWLGLSSPLSFGTFFSIILDPVLTTVVNRYPIDKFSCFLVASEVLYLFS